MAKRPAGRGPGRPRREEREQLESSSSFGAPYGDAILDQTAESDRVHVSRFDARAGTWNYAGAYEPAAVTVSGTSEFLRQRGGGGKYRVRIRRSDGTWGQSATLTIDGAARPWDDGNGSSASSLPAVSSSSSAGASSRDMPAWLERIVLPVATSLGSLLVKKLLENPQHDPLTLELLKYATTNRGGALDPVELQKLVLDAETRAETRGREMGRLAAIAETPAPATDLTTGALGAIDRNLPQLIGLLGRKLDIDEQREERMRRPLPSSSSSSLPAPGPVTDTAGAEGAPVSVDPLVTLLRTVPLVARRFLLSGAENDEGPESYAGLVLEKLDDVTFARLPELLERADFVDVFVREWPAFAELRPWVEEFAEVLKASHAATVATRAAESDDAGGAGDIAAEA